MRLCALINDRKVQKGLDRGCAVGRNLVYLSGQGFEIQGLETLVASTGSL